jgi:hypothetical protein
MESWRARLGSIAPIPPGWFAPPKTVPAGRRGATETATGFKKEIRLASPIHYGAALDTEKPTAYEKNIEYLRRLHVQASRGIRLVHSVCGRLPVKCTVFQFPSGA